MKHAQPAFNPDQENDASENRQVGPMPLKPFARTLPRQFQETAHSH